jgi:hypothetical protein
MIPLVLAMPWGLCAQTPLAGLEVRRPLPDHYETVDIDGRHGAMLALPAEADLRFVGRRWREQQEGGIFPWIGGNFRLSALPTAALTVEQHIGLEVDHNGRKRNARLKLNGHLLRPRGSTASQEPDAADAMHEFVLQVLGRIREAQTELDAEGWPDFGTGWDRLRARWLHRAAHTEDAPRDLIVEHAEQLPNRVNETAERPRRVLKRTRQLMAIDRIQELDNACMEWLIRQPGLTVAEKAGPRQRLKGIAREENHDTLENRVLKDFLRLSIEEAQAYLRANKRHGQSERVRLVGRYHALCHRHHRELCAVGIGNPTHPVTPNYVLQQDARYRVIWRAYREILSAEQRKDDLWRWQRRLWADFARLAIVVAIDHLSARQRITLSPLHIRREQANGRWSDTGLRLALFVLRLAQRRLILEIFDTTLPDPHPALAPWLYALGCTAVIQLTDCDSGHTGSLCIWAVHGVAAQPVPLADLVSSADEALRVALGQEQLRTGQRIKGRGLVIRSTPDRHGEYATQPANLAYGVALDVDPEKIREALEECALILEDSMERLLA